MRQFALRQFGGDGGGLGGINLVGVSEFDRSQMSSLDSHYEMKGRGVLYNGVPKQVMIVDQQSTISPTDFTTQVETLVVMVRRYGSSFVEQPSTGDALILANDGGVAQKRYKLTEVPSEAFSHLEWELRFSRTKTIRQGGQHQLPYGGA